MIIYISKKTIFLFSEDELEYKNILKQKREKELQDFSEIFINETKEYFKDGKLPDKYEDWPFVLIGRNEMDLRFKSYLTSALEEYLKCVRWHYVTDELKKKFNRFLDAKSEVEYKRKTEEKKKQIEEERKKQMIRDEQGRKYIVSEVVMIDGKEVYVPMNSDEVRVVRK